VDCESSKSQERLTYEPNHAMLNKLHNEMRKLSQDSSTEVGILVTTDNSNTSCYFKFISNLCNVILSQVADDIKMRHLLLEKESIITKLWLELTMYLNGTI